MYAVMSSASTSIAGSMNVNSRAFDVLSASNIISYLFPARVDSAPLANRSACFCLPIRSQTTSFWLCLISSGPFRSPRRSAGFCFASRRICQTKKAVLGASHSEGLGRFTFNVLPMRHRNKSGLRDNGASCDRQSTQAHCEEGSRAAGRTSRRLIARSEEQRQVNDETSRALRRKFAPDSGFWTLLPRR